jgi:hypothetical protein
MPSRRYIAFAHRDVSTYTVFPTPENRRVEIHKRGFKYPVALSLREPFCDGDAQVLILEQI